MTQSLRPTKSKSQFLAVFLATIPGLGHVYIGKVKRGVQIFAAFVIALIIQVIVVLPLIIDPILVYFGQTDDMAPLNQMLTAFVSLPFWFYIWQFRDTHLLAEPHDPRRVKLS